MRRLFDGITLTVTAALVGLSLWVRPRLPDRIPTHFGANGMPDAWSDTSLFSWMLMPLLAVITFLALRWTGNWIARRPDRMNFPGIEGVAGLPERFREPVSEAIRETMALVSLETVSIFALVQYGTWMGAQGESSQSVMFGVLAVALLGSPVMLVFVFLRMQRAIDASVKAARAAGHGEPAPAAEPTRGLP